MAGSEGDVDDEVGERKPLQVDNLPVHTSARTIDLDLVGEVRKGKGEIGKKRERERERELVGCSFGLREKKLRGTKKGWAEKRS